MTPTPPNPPLRPVPTDEDVVWVASHLPEVRRRLASNEILYWWIGGALVLGLVANVLGFLWSSVAGDTVQALIADLLRNLGTALWTGVVLVLFVQVLPEIHRRYAIRELHRYEREIEEQHLATPDGAADERDS